MNYVLGSTFRYFIYQLLVCSNEDIFTPMLRSTSVRRRVRFKLTCIMYKSLSGQAPSTSSMMSSYLLTACGVYFDQPTTEHASFHGHRTVSATEPFLLLNLKSGTIYHWNCDTWTSALDNSDTC